MVTDNDRRTPVPAGVPGINVLRLRSIGKSPWHIVQMYTTEIGLKTYFRTPQEMTETPLWWKLQCAEVLNRQMRADIENHDWAPLWMQIKAFFKAIKDGRRFEKASLKKKSDWRL